MKKILFTVIMVLIGIGVIPLITSVVGEVSVEDVSIEYTLTTTATVISHDLTDDEFDYIIANAEYISDHTDVEFLVTGIETYVSSSDETTYIGVTFSSSELLMFTVIGRTLTSETNAPIEGAQVVSIYFEDIPLTNTYVIILSLIPMIFIAGILAVMWKKRDE